jgi:hypothetical protein
MRGLPIILSAAFFTAPFAMLWLMAEPLLSIDKGWMPETLQPFLPLIPAMMMSTLVVWGLATTRRA